MITTAPYWREAGSGPAIVCLHSNASVSGQWRMLMTRLADRYRVLAPDSYGSGRSPDWPSDSVITLQDEVDLIEPVLQSAGDPFVLVGHSYGAAIALRTGVRCPARVRAMIVYEPTLFSLIEAEGPAPNDADGIRDAVDAAATALRAGDRLEAARCFIDYWMGSGAWANTPDERRIAIADSVANVRRWAHALFTEPTPISEFGRLRMPVLYLTGGRSTQSARGVGRRLIKALPNVTHVDLPELGHMAPITDPEIVNQAIEDFLLGLA